MTSAIEEDSRSSASCGEDRHNLSEYILDLGVSTQVAHRGVEGDVADNPASFERSTGNRFLDTDFRPSSHVYPTTNLGVGNLQPMRKVGSFKDSLEFRGSAGGLQPREFNFRSRSILHFVRV